MRQVLLAVLFASACGQEKNGTKSSFSRRDMLKFGASTAVLSAAGLAVGSYLENIDQWLSEHDEWLPVRGPKDPAVYELPLVFIEGMAFIEYDAGEAETLRMLVDTGSRSSLISSEASERIKWPLPIADPDSFVTVLRTYLRSRRYPTLMTKVYVAPFEQPMPAGSDGVLGADQLRRFAAVEFDWAAKVLRLHTKRWNPPWEPIRCISDTPECHPRAFHQSTLLRGTVDEALPLVRAVFKGTRAATRVSRQHLGTIVAWRILSPSRGFHDHPTNPVALPPPPLCPTPTPRTRSPPPPLAPLVGEGGSTVKVQALVDTGTALTMVSPMLAERARLTPKEDVDVQVTDEGIRISLSDEDTLAPAPKGMEAFTCGSLILGLAKGEGPTGSCGVRHDNMTVYSGIVGRMLNLGWSPPVEGPDRWSTKPAIAGQVPTLSSMPKDFESGGFFALVGLDALRAGVTAGVVNGKPPAPAVGGPLVGQLVFDFDGGRLVFLDKR